MKEWKVSLITVSYNAEKTIERTIKSVLSQSYPNIEYVIVDGASTDGTMELVNKHGSKIDVVISEPDDGIYDAINKGIRHSSGDIIGIINSDDWYEQNAVETVVEAFRKYDVEVTCGNVMTHNAFGESDIIHANLDRDPIYGNTIPHPSLFVKREVYEELGLYDTNYTIAADYKWMLNCIKSDRRIRYLDCIIAHFSESGISSTCRYKTVLQSAHIAEEYLRKNNAEKEWASIKEYWEDLIVRAKGEEEILKNHDAVNEYFHALGLKRVVIWGTGHYGKMMARVLMDTSIEVAYFMDSDKNKTNTSLMGLKVVESGYDLADDFLLFAIDVPEEKAMKIMMEKGYTQTGFITLRQLQQAFSAMK